MPTTNQPIFPPTEKPPIGLIRAFIALSFAVLAFALLDYATPDYSDMLVIDKATTSIRSGQPYYLDTKNRETFFRTEILYKKGQNGALDIGLIYGCVMGIYVNPAPEADRPSIPSAIPNTTICGGKSVNLTPHLKEGFNTIYLLVRSNLPTKLYISPALFGYHLLSSIACVIFLGIALYGLYHIARRAGLNKPSFAILAGGVLYFSSWMVLLYNTWSSNDVYGHIDYTEYIANQWFSPAFYFGREYFQPPTYYYLTGTVYSLFRDSEFINPLSAVRAVSLALFSIYCLYGIRTLRLCVKHENLAYYVACILLVFWPVNMIMATRINNDIALTAAWAAMLFYAARWWQLRDMKDLRFALCALAIAFAIKSSAVVPAFILGMCMLAGLLTRRIAWKSLFGRHCFLGYIAVLTGIAINVSKAAYLQFWHKRDITNLHFGGTGPNFMSWDHFLRFDIKSFIERPQLIRFDEPGYLNYAIKTLLYGEFIWKWPMIATAINYLVLALLALLIAGLAKRLMQWRAQEYGITPYVLGIMLPLLSVSVFTYVKHNFVCQDSRFIVPVLIAFVALYLNATLALKSRWTYPLYILALLVAVALPLAGMVFYLGQFK